MTEDVIEFYDTFNSKGFPNELLFGGFCDQPIPPVYFDFLNENNDENNINIGTPVNDVFLDNERVEDAVIPKAPTANDYDKNNHDDTEEEDSDAYIDTSVIDSLED